ncbi:MAG: hypothetical protein JW915_04575 [Chitinispirillaceae bacterium]|nr:hypothetical protein [Chitinispirillaceae bacterium]
MKKIIEFLSAKGMYIMMSGFIIALAGVVLMLTSQKNFWGEQAKTISMAVAIFGFVVYLTGRIFVGSERRKRRQSSSSSLSSKDSL